MFEGNQCFTNLIKVDCLASSKTNTTLTRHKVVQSVSLLNTRWRHIKRQLGNWLDLFVKFIRVIYLQTNVEMENDFFPEVFPENSEEDSEEVTEFSDLSYDSQSVSVPVTVSLGIMIG